MNILGIDHGTKRIGVAIARGGVKIAYPLTTILNDSQTVDSIKTLIEIEKVTLIVLGLPRNLKAQDTQQTRLVREFKDDISELGIDVHFQDETTSTDRAIERGAGKADKDAWAAALILQDYLEGVR